MANIITAIRSRITQNDFSCSKVSLHTLRNMAAQSFEGPLLSDDYIQVFYFSSKAPRDGSYSEIKCHEM